MSINKNESLFITKLILIIFVIVTLTLLAMSIAFAFGMEEFKNDQNCYKGIWLERGCLNGSR